MTVPRTPRLSPEEMAPRQRELHEHFTTGPRADPANPFRLFDDEGYLTGPPSAWVLSPEIGHALEKLGYQMRWGIHASGKTREAVILAVAHAEASPFELFAHEPAGREGRLQRGGPRGAASRPGAGRLDGGDEGRARARARAHREPHAEATSPSSGRSRCSAATSCSSSSPSSATTSSSRSPLSAFRILPPR